MSRIGKLPVLVPAGVEVKISGTSVSVKGPKGHLEHTFPAYMLISQEGTEIIVNRPSDERLHRSMHGTTRAVISNMVNGVSTGFERVLQIEGVGYRAELRGQDLVLNLGYSHEIVIKPPEGVSFEVDGRGREVKIKGHDTQALGQLAADIRKLRPPEPYKGKGIRYLGERIQRKAGKAGRK